MTQPFTGNPCHIYTSTRGDSKAVSFDQAVLQGFALDGGLFVPKALPSFSLDELKGMAGMAYTELAVYILSRFIDPAVIPGTDLERLILKSFSSFDHPDIIPLVPCPLRPDLRIMELFRGPTLSFKDIAMGFLVRVMDYLLAKGNRKLNLVLATTGDTGPAAAHAAAGLSTMDCWPLFPKGMITLEQEVQMTSLTASNIHPVGVENCPDGGDDLDRVVLNLFSDPDLKNKLQLSSVNSINWCRVMVQAVHYFYGYFRACKTIVAPVVFSVPSGAFGNLFAGFLARKMGLPVQEFICAVNANQTLYRAFTTGVFKNEALISTCSSAIDIVVPYNFWRFLYFASGRNAVKIRTWMDEFHATGQVIIDPETLNAIQNGFVSTSVSDQQTLATIKAVYKADPSYLLDPHGAVAVAGAKTMAHRYSAGTSIVCLATAHPAKFPDIIAKALGGKSLPQEATHASLVQAKKADQKLEVCELRDLEGHLINRMQTRNGKCNG